MTFSAFINSLRRFVAMRGKVTEFYSDRGTNFVGSTDALNINAINIESPTLKKYMVENGSTWIFNPPIRYGRDMGKEHWNSAQNF